MFEYVKGGTDVSQFLRTKLNPLAVGQCTSQCDFLFFRSRLLKLNTIHLQKLSLMQRKGERILTIPLGQRNMQKEKILLQILFSECPPFWQLNILFWQKWPQRYDGRTWRQPAVWVLPMYGLLHSVPSSLASGTRLLRARAGDSANSPFLSVAGEQTALDGPVVLGLCCYWFSLCSGGL